LQPVSVVREVEVGVLVGGDAVNRVTALKEEDGLHLPFTKDVNAVEGVTLAEHGAAVTGKVHGYAGGGVLNLCGNAGEAKVRAIGLNAIVGFPEAGV
jgi:hypothetical protein